MRFLDRLLPPGLKSTEEIQRGRTIIGISLGLAATIFFGLPIRLQIGALPLQVAGVTLFTGGLFLFTPLLLHYTASTKKAGALLIAGLFILVEGAGSLLGGATAPILFLAPVIPLAAAVLLGVWLGRMITVLLLGSLVLLFSLSRRGWLPTSPLSDAESELARFLVLAMSIVLIWLLIAIHEQQRIQAVQEMKRNRELYEKIFEQSKDIVVLSTVQGELLDINSAGVEFFAEKGKEALLAQGVEALYIDLEERKGLLKTLERDGFAQGYESNLRTASGQARTVQGTTTAVRGEHGQVEALLTILRDVTEERRRTEEREDLVRRLKERSAELERFAYTVSHDLKSPLVTILGFAGMAEKDVVEGDLERVTTDLERIQTAATKMSALLEGVLELSRIGRAADPSDALDLSEIIDEVQDLLAGPLRESGTLIQVSGNLPRIRGDSQRLVQVFQNLIENAIKYGRTQTEPRVWIDARPDEGRILCTVRDNGQGIDPEHQDKVFGLFEQIDSRDDGLGIGLALVQRIVQVHGGTIWVESEGEDQGSTFFFTLPSTKNRKD